METTTDTTTVATTTFHESSHHRLVEEIATRVEEKLVAKFARWLAVNLLVVLGLVATIIGTYYSLDNRITEAKRVDELQDRLLTSHQVDNQQLRNDLLTEIRDLKRGQDEINRFLRDHNSEMNARLKKVP
jgi:Mg2+ and Co2+ transporter CorA